MRFGRFCPYRSWPVCRGKSGGNSWQRPERRLLPSFVADLRELEVCRIMTVNKAEECANIILNVHIVSKGFILQPVQR